MRPSAKHRVSYVIVMRDLHSVKKNTVFKLGGISDYAPCADDYRATYKRAGAQYGTLSYYRRRLDHYAGIYFYILTHKHAVT